MSKFTTAAKARTAITFELDGDEFTFTPPKQASMILPMLDGEDDLAVVRAGLHWLGDGLDEKQNEYLMNRLKDPKDDFDLPDLQPVIEWLIEEAAGERPTS